MKPYKQYIISTTLPREMAEKFEEYKKDHPEFNTSGYLRQFIKKLLEGM